MLSRARVLLLSRKAENAEAAIVKIKESQLKQAGPVADVTFIPCDLGNLGHVKKVADQIRDQEARLDLMSLRRLLHRQNSKKMMIPVNSSSAPQGLE